MAIYDGDTGRFPVQTTGELVYVQNGDLYLRRTTKSILVGSQSD